jgi:hypothetical protein
MGTPRYDSFEIAVLTDAVLTAEEKARCGKLTTDDISSVLREVAHVLEVLLEPEAAQSCRNLADDCDTDLEEYKTLYDDLQKGVDHILSQFDVDEEYLPKLADELMWIPDGFTAKQVEALADDERRRQEDEG